MGAMGGRPVLMQRFPSGVGGSSFFQKRVPDRRPRLARDDGREHARTARRRGAGRRRPRPRRLGGQPRLPRLPRVAQPRERRPRHADELRIDLDPQPGVDFDELASPRPRGARRSSTSSASRRGRRPRATGASTCTCGLHPRWTPIEVRAAAVAVARELARRRPDLITDAWWKEERGERVFVDFNQNAPHKTVFGAWSVRARPGAQVSTPFAWDELDDIDPDACTMATVPGARRSARRPVGRRRRRSAVAGAAARDVRRATSRRDCRTRRGRPSTRRCPANRPASPRAGRRRRRRRRRPRRRRRVRSAAPGDG